jgi:hypothetical protein
MMMRATPCFKHNTATTRNSGNESSCAYKNELSIVFSKSYNVCFVLFLLFYRRSVFRYICEVPVKHRLKIFMSTLFVQVISPDSIYFKKRSVLHV